jgi:hypothetical protein
MKPTVCTIRRFLIEICKRPGITAKDLSERLDDFPIRETIRVIESLRRNRVVNVEGAGVSESIASNCGDESSTIQAALNAGLDVDRLISN